MATQDVSAVTTASTKTTNPIDSTKAKVVTNGGAVYFAVGNASVAANNTTSEIIPANSTRFVNMQGINNYIAFQAVSANTAVSVTACGSIDATRVGLY